MTEGDLQEHVVHLLRSHGRKDVAWCAVANGDARSPSVGARLKRQGVIAGAPDIILCIDGRYHGLELKTEYGRLSDAQTSFGCWILGAGGTYHVAHGMDEAFRYLRDIGALKDNVTLTFPNPPTGRRGVINFKSRPSGT